MDKNTIWAIVLSTLVIVASYLLLPRFFPGLRQNNEVAVETSQTEEVQESAELSLDSTEINPVVEEASDETEAVVTQEEKFTVTTDKVEVVLTNRGGDIISYKLLDHLDPETNEGVQLSDNVTSTNRTAAISFGSIADNSNIVNELFEVEKINEYTYLFKKNIVVNGQKVKLWKKYEFKPGEYVFKLDVMIHPENGQGLNINDVAYTIRTSPQIGPKYDSKDRYDYRQFVTYNGSKYKKPNVGTNQFKRNDKDSIWTGIASKYFIEMIIPSSSEIVSGTYYSSKVETNNVANAQAFTERRAFSGTDVQDTYYMYFGPREEKSLKRYNSAENNGWGIGGKKLSIALQTSGWLNWLETILKWFMKILYKVIPNWGLTIIVMTLILKIVLFPISKKQSMGTLKMQELQPKLQAIQAKYKDEPQKMQMETSKIYKEAGYNPASGCLPMLFQFLVLFAMYNLFNNYFDFWGAMFIPGWIPDLSKPDSVYMLNFNIPLLGNAIRILPVIYVATQLLSGKITQYGQTAAPGQSQATMKFMMYGMPLMFFFMFYNAPSGLLLYWLTSNVLQIGQQLLINKMMKAKREEMGLDNKTQKTLPPKAKGKRK